MRLFNLVQISDHSFYLLSLKLNNIKQQQTHKKITRKYAEMVRNFSKGFTYFLSSIHGIWLIVFFSCTIHDRNVLCVFLVVLGIDRKKWNNICMLSTISLNNATECIFPLHCFVATFKKNEMTDFAVASIPDLRAQRTKQYISFDTE